MPSITNYSRKSPYKGLQTYSEADRLFFFGREKWRKIIGDNLEASRLTVLYGSSGIGKSSVLRAGVAYHLDQIAEKNLEKYGKPGLAVVVFPSQEGELTSQSSSESLLSKIKRAIAKKIENLCQDSLIQPHLLQNSLVEILQEGTKIVQKEEGGGRLFIILDQFEDCLTYLLKNQQEDHDRFVDELSAAINDPNLNVHFLISIREAALAQLDYFKGRIPNLLGNRLGLKALDGDAAKEAIEKPIYEYNRQTIILDSLDQSRLTILSGDRNTYKTTLLRLGIAHFLQENNLGVVVFNDWYKQQDWQTALKQQIERDLKPLIKENSQASGKFISPKPDLSLLKTLQQWTQLVGQATGNSQLFIILDQFEEYFCNQHKMDKDREFIKDLVEAINEESLKVNFLIAISKRGLSALQNFLDILPCQYYLHLYKNETGNDCIEEQSIATETIQFNELEERQQKLEAKFIKIDADLPNIIVQHIQDKADGLITVPYLQLIMTRLWNEESLKFQNKKVPSLQLRKTTYKNLGVENIVKEHLSKQIDKLNDIEREVAYRILYYLITPSGKQLLTLSVEDLAKFADQNRLSEEPELQSQKVKELLEKLSEGDSRLLSSTASGYRIFFPGLADEVLKWVNEQRQIKCLEKDAENAKKKFKARKIKQIEGLISLIETGKIIRNNPKLVGYSFTVKIISILQEVFGEIQEKNKFDLPGSSVYGINFNPSGSDLAMGSSDGTLLIWNFQTNELYQLSKEKSSPIYYVSFSPDGKKLAVALGNGTIHLWNMESQQQLNQLLKCGNSAFSYLSFSEDGKLAASAIDGTVCLWDLGNGTSQLLGKNQYPGFFFSCVSISPDGKKLACASLEGAEGKVYLLDATDENLKMQPTPFPGSQEHIVYLSFVSGGKQLVAASQHGTFYQWNMEEEGNKKSPSTSTLIKGLGLIYRISFSPDNKYLATVGADGTAYLWDRQAKKAEEVRDESENIETFGDDKVTYCSFSPHGNQLATASSDGTVSLWDRDSKKLVDSIKLSQKPHRVNFSSSEQAKLNKLAIACFDGTIYLWDLESKEKVEFTKLNNPVWCASFNPDGTKLVSASEDGIVRFWDLKTKEVVNSKDIKSPTYHINFSPDGQYLVIASVDCIAYLWNLKNDKEKLQELHHKSPISWVSFSPDGKYLAIASGDTVSLWEMQNKEKITLRHEDLVWCLNFIPNKQQLATACVDGFVRVWSWQGALIAEFPMNKPVVCVSPSPDGKWLAAATWEGIPRLINLDGEIDERRETLNSLLEKGIKWVAEYDTVQKQMEKLTKGDCLQDLLPEQSS